MRVEKGRTVLEETDIRTLMDLGWQAAKACHFTGRNILSFGSFADVPELSPGMIAMWSRSFAYAAYVLREEAIKRGYEFDGD